MMYLEKLGADWVIGMAMEVVVLSALFESHVSIGYIRFHIASDFRRIYSGAYGSKRRPFSGILYIPCLIFLGCGVLTGAVTVVKAIKVCLKKFRPQTIYMILGMMKKKL